MGFFVGCSNDLRELIFLRMHRPYQTTAERTHKPMDFTLITSTNDQTMDNNQAATFPLILFKMNPNNYHSSHLEAI